MSSENVTIETCTECNAKCIICPNGQKARPHHQMPLEEFEAIIKFFPQLKTVVLCGMYEPLLESHERLDKILTLIEKVHPTANVTIFTNGSLLTQEKGLMLTLHPSFRNLVVSIHGASKEVYESVMGLDYHTVYTNVLNFLDLIAYDPTIHVSVSFVRIKQNIHELNDFLRFWTGKVDEVSDFECMNWRGAVDKNQLLYEFPKYTRACPMFEQPLVIDAHGNVVRCCYDFSFNYGHVLHGGYEAWKTKKGISATYPTEECKTCLGWRHY